MNALIEAKHFSPSYAKAGLHMLPLKDRQPERDDSLRRASTHFAAVEKMFRSGRANIGIATGAISSVFVLIVDPSGDGTASLARLQADHGALPATLTARDCQGRTYLVFQLPTSAKVSGSVALSQAGLRVKGDGEFIIAPPSQTEERMEWVGWKPGDEIKIAQSPVWLMSLAAGRPLPVPVRREAATVEDDPQVIAAVAAVPTPATEALPSPPQIAPREASMLDKALSLSERGLRVFPLGTFGEDAPAYVVADFHKGNQAEANEAWPKRPRVAWAKYQVVAPTEEEVRAWWGKWPNANIGIACGELVVVDADSNEAVKWCEANLPHTIWRVKTAKGRHYYYCANAEVEIRNSTDPTAKLDTRGLGGYVVAAGSRHSSGARYVEEIDSDQDANTLTVSDLPMLGKVHVEAITSYRAGNVQALGDAGGNLAGFDADKSRVKADGSPVAEGGRNDAAASLAGQYIASGLSLRDTKRILDGWNATNLPPLSDSELNTTIASVARTHQANHPDKPIAYEAAEPRGIAKFDGSPPPFPAHLLTPPGLVGDVAKWITSTAIKPQPVLSLAAAISLCAVVMGRKVQTRTFLRTNTYILAVADSSSGKEWPRQAIKTILDAAGGIQLIGAEDLASDSGLFAAIVRSPSCLLLIDEIGRFFMKLNKQNAQPYLTDIMAYFQRLTGSTKGRFLEKIRAEHANVEPRSVMDPNVCLFGTTVPGRLSQGIKRDDISDGFLPRMLVLQSDTPNPPKNGVSDRTPPESIVELVHSWVLRPVNSDPTGNLDQSVNPLFVDCSPDAQAVFDAFEVANNARYSKTLRTGFDAVWGRADEHAKRLALVLACGCSFENPVIDRPHAEWACELVLFAFDRMILEIDDNMADNEHEGIIKKVLKAVAEKGTVAKSTLMRMFRGIKAEAWGSILATLQETGDVSLRTVVPDGGRGRPGVWIDCTGVHSRKETKK